MHALRVAAVVVVLATGIAHPAGQTSGYLVAVASEAADTPARLSFTSWTIFTSSSAAPALTAFTAAFMRLT